MGGLEYSICPCEVDPVIRGAAADSSFAWLPHLQVNLNHENFEIVESRMKDPRPGLFDEAQHFTYQLMARDSYPRFIKTKHFQDALRQAEGR